MADEEPAQILFRASKRRKVLRKPAHADGEPDAQDPEDAITEQPMDAAGVAPAGVSLVRRRGGVGKTGISFSTTASRRVAESEHEEDGALVLVEEGGALQMPGRDRFVKPTGRVGPTEDRHMMAYVDSKLAESRAPTDKAKTRPNVEIIPMPSDMVTEPRNGVMDTNSGSAKRTLPSTTTQPYRHAREATHKPSQRPNRRKGPPQRKEADIARDTIIEQIMGENQIPHYAQGSSTGMGQDVVAEGEDIDPDAAAADAFKAQLLADLEQSNRRRRAPAAAANKAGASASMGPKLGGSRSQRERMKALEEARAAGKK